MGHCAKVNQVGESSCGGGTRQQKDPVDLSNPGGSTESTQEKLVRIMHTLLEVVQMQQQ